MRIVVLVKQVPTDAGTLSYTTGHALDRAGSPARLDEIDEVAVDQAVRIACCRRDVRVTAVTMGPPGAERALHRALVLGADEAVHVCDDALAGVDALATSRVLAAAIDRLGFDLVLGGAGSSDSAMSAVPAMVAERLGVAVLGRADALAVDENEAEIHRGAEVLAAVLPVVVSVTAASGPPRYPTFVARAASRHKSVRTWSLADLGLDDNDVRPATVVYAIAPAGSPTRPVVHGDAASAAVRVADFLAEHQFL